MSIVGVAAAIIVWSSSKETDLSGIYSADSIVGSSIEGVTELFAL